MHSNGSLWGSVQIFSAFPLFFGRVCGIWTFGFSSDDPFFFFSLSSLIFALELLNFQISHSLCLAFRFCPYFFKLFLFLFKVIYKIIFFQFNPPLIFLFVEFDSHYFDYYLFCSKSFSYFNLFFHFIPRHFDLILFLYQI
jgi:hypothetical protein